MANFFFNLWQTYENIFEKSKNAIEEYIGTCSYPLHLSNPKPMQAYLKI